MILWSAVDELVVRGSHRKQIGSWYPPAVLGGGEATWEVVDWASEAELFSESVVNPGVSGRGGHTGDGGDETEESQVRKRKTTLYSVPLRGSCASEVWGEGTRPAGYMWPCGCLTSTLL